MRRTIQALVLALATTGALGLGASAALAKPLAGDAEPLAGSCPPACSAVRCNSCPPGTVHACVTDCCNCVPYR